jgi:hypothetical protein
VESVDRSAPHPRAGALAAGVLVAFGVAWLAWSWRCDLRYCERHLLRDYAATDPRDAAIAWGWRVASGVLGVVSLAAAPFVGRWVRRVGPAGGAAGLARIGAALVLALVAAEIGMRALHLPSPHDTSTRTEVRIGERDARYGWRYVASRASVLRHGGRDIEYAIDARHDRAPSLAAAIDPRAPTLIFAGESITAGHGLTWDESYPALVGRALDLQVVDLGVHGYGVDQAFLRLHDELSSFERPVAVVSFFYLPMLARMNDDTHPHLVFDGVEPRVVPVDGFFRELRLARVWREVVRYRDDSTLELAARIFRETDRLARAHGARAVFVAPGCWAAGRPDAYLVDELFAQQGLEVVDPSWALEHLPDDFHPSPAWTQRLADAVAAALRRDLASR